jgi:hypothetical protein
LLADLRDQLASFVRCSKISLLYVKMYFVHNRVGFFDRTESSINSSYSALERIQKYAN